MKKLNNKGFAITVMLYSILAIIAMTMFLILAIMSGSRKANLELIDSIKEDLNNNSYHKPEDYEETVFYNYTGNYETFEVRVPGYYKLEVWGAQGGSGYSTYLGTGYSYGGKGGYAVGEKYFDKGTILYVYVGGQGEEGGTTKNNLGIRAGGFNGGGTGRSWHNGNSYVHNGAGGGGATDIRTVAEDLSSRLIVAGGGGGGGGHEPNATGGEGGGLIGGNASNPSGLWNNTVGATSTTGGYDSGNSGFPGKLGQGGNSALVYGSGGGGGGYYGGGGGSWTPGSGGSSYISNLDNASTNANVQTGNGQAIITFIGAFIDNQTEN